MDKEVLEPGFKMTEIGPIPCDWRVMPVSAIAQKLKAGGTPNRSVAEYWGGDIPFVLIKDITAAKFNLAGAREFITESGVENSSAWVVPPNSILLTMYGTIGRTAINTIPVTTNQAILAIVPGPELNAEFGAFALAYQAPRLAIRNVQSTQKNVSKQIVENFPLPLPPLPEQRAIAQVLSAVRRAIDATEAVIEAAQALKKSLMQHLFTYGPVPVDQIDQVPLKETEIGPVPEGWEVVRLGDVADVRGGKRLPKGHKFASEITPFPYIRVVDFIDGTVSLGDLRYLKPEDREIIKRYVISCDDVYISIAGTIASELCRASWKGPI